MTFPSFIPETVIVTAVSVKTDMEPVLVWGIPFLLLHILKCPEASSDMIEYTVQHNLYIMFMQIFTDLFKIFICTESAVDLLKISCIISMIVRFKDRI